MAAGDWVGTGTGTLSAEGPGDIATVDITVSGCASGDYVALTPLGAARDTNGPFVPYVSGTDTDTVTVSIDRAQLTEDLDVRVIVFDQ